MLKHEDDLSDMFGGCVGTCGRTGPRTPAWTAGSRPSPGKKCYADAMQIAKGVGFGLVLTHGTSQLLERCCFPVVWKRSAVDGYSSCTNQAAPLSRSALPDLLRIQPSLPRVQTSPWSGCSPTIPCPTPIDDAPRTFIIPPPPPTPSLFFCRRSWLWPVLLPSIVI